MKNLTPLITHPAFRDRLGRMTAEARNPRRPKVWWRDDPPPPANEGTGCAVALIVLTIASYALIALLFTF